MEVRSILLRVEERCFIWLSFISYLTTLQYIGGFGEMVMGVNEAYFLL